MKTKIYYLNTIAMMAFAFSFFMISCEKEMVEVQHDLASGSRQLKAVPVDTDDWQMFATNVTYGDFVPVKLPLANIARLCPENALGEFDAVSGTGFNEKFFAVASREWVEYTFEDRFMNVNGVPDIEFVEITWGSGNSWHVEAVLVYLTDARVRNNDGDIVSYGKTDEGIGYYAGIAWNRTGIQYVTEERRLEITESYLPEVDRDFDANEFAFVGTFGFTYFNLPEEVVDAEGIYLIDITKDVYNEGSIDGGYSTGSSVLVTDVLNCPITGSDDVEYTSGQVGNTDGYDLDAIRVYKAAPDIGDDTATGLGERIRPRGSWFMYNVYTEAGGTQCFNLHAGNPEDYEPIGSNIIGEYCVVDNENGTFTATFEFDATIEKDGWIYDIVIGDKHLAISQTMDFTGAPGRDANAEWGEPFEAVAPFCIFAHFEVNYE